MTAVKEETKKEEKKSIWSKEEKEKIKSEYGCDIVVEDGSLEDVRTKKAPTDSYIYIIYMKINFILILQEELR